MLQGLRELVQDVNNDVYGVPASVTVPSGVPVPTTVIWLEPTTDNMPANGEFRRSEQRRLLSIRKDAVATVPRGTIVAVTGESGTWRVDGVETIASDRHHVYVLPVAP